MLLTRPSVTSDCCSIVLFDTKAVPSGPEGFRKMMVNKNFQHFGLFILLAVNVPHQMSLASIIGEGVRLI